MFSIFTRAVRFSTKQSVRSISFITSNHAPLMPSNRNGLSSSLLASSSSPIATSQTYTSNIISTQLSPIANFLQLRWGTRGGNRGNTYQPNTLKRKRRLGFLSRMKSRTGRQIVKRRTDKGRWFLTH